MSITVNQKVSSMRLEEIRKEQQEPTKREREFDIGEESLAKKRRVETSSVAQEALKIGSVEAGSPQSKVQNGEGIAEPLKSVETKKTAFSFIRDDYTSARGDPRMIELFCQKCGAWVMDYQKDGPGALLRCYVDRIHAPAELANRVFTQQTVSRATDLKCRKCFQSLGAPFIYRRRFPKPEVRPAYIILEKKDGAHWKPRVKIQEKRV